MDKGLLLIAGLLAVLGWPLRASAALPAQLLANPPSINAMLFAADAIYLGLPGTLPAEAADPVPLPGEPVGTPTEIWYRLDRKTDALSHVAGPPADARGIPISTLQLTNLGRDWSSVAITYTATSDGDVYSMGSPYCGQISNNGRLLKMDCTPLGPTVAPGELITAIEAYGPYVILGTVAMVPGTMATQSGRGALVLSAKTGALVRTISETDGLAGSAIQLIRRDPDTGRLWIETPRALAELSSTFQVLNVLYLHLDFDSDGVPALKLTADPQYDDPYAVLALKLHVTDFAGFQKAIAAIPAAARDSVFTEVFPQGQPQGRTLPPAFQPLAPFVLADLERDPDPRQSAFALAALCRLGGSAASSEADTLIATTIKGVASGNFWYAVKACADPAVVAAHRPATPNYSLGGGRQGMAVAYAAQNRVTGPDLTIGSFTPVMLWWDGRHAVHLHDITEDDAAGVGPSLTRFYASPTLPVDPVHAVAIAEHPVPALGIGATTPYEMDVMLPASLPPGLYYVAVCANADQKQQQAFEEDRCRIPRSVPPRASAP